MQLTAVIASIDAESIDRHAVLFACEHAAFRCRPMTKPTALKQSVEAQRLSVILSTPAASQALSAVVNASVHSVAVRFVASTIAVPPPQAE